MWTVSVAPLLYMQLLIYIITGIIYNTLVDEAQTKLTQMATTYHSRSIEILNPKTFFLQIYSKLDNP